MLNAAHGGPNMTNSHRLRDTGFLRLTHIIGDPHANPAVPPLIPVSSSTWWAGVKSGRFPPPVKLGPRITAWRVEDIQVLIISLWSENK